MNSRFFKILFHLGFVCCLNVGSGQISFSNPSFEDQPADATVPQGWLPCALGTTPDILPGFWGEYGEAQDGDTYIGLITRQDGSHESIGQRFSDKLQEKGCYHFKISLAKGEDYIGFSKPLKLRIWIGANLCDKQQMIFESKLIENTSWEVFEVKFSAKKTSQYMIIEAFHSDVIEDYKGNILIDNMSFVFSCDRV